MKLEFESNAVSSPLVGSQVPAEFQQSESSTEVLETLKEGIAAAQAGERAEARVLLMKVTEVDPNNENAWLWLASISEYPEELLVFLNNVLSINPKNERAKEWSAATKSLIAKTFVQRGIDAAKDEQHRFAKQCFLQAIVHDAKSELAWLWLASVSETTDEKISHLQKVLQLNPNNENAKSSLKSAKDKGAHALLPKANSAAISGDRETAGKLLEKIFEASPDFEDAWMLKAHISESFADKISAFEKVLQINPENQVARANVESLKMFEQNQEETNDEPKVGFEGAKYKEEPEFESVPDPVAPTESYDADSLAAEGVEFDASEVEVESYETTDDFAPEQEAVAFEDVAEAIADKPEEFSAETEPAESVEEAVAFEDSEAAEDVVFVSGDHDAALDHNYEEEAVDVADNVVEFESAAEDDEIEVETVAEATSSEFNEESVEFEQTSAEVSDEYQFHADVNEEEDHEPEASFEAVEEEVSEPQAVVEEEVFEPQAEEQVDFESSVPVEEVHQEASDEVETVEEAEFNAEDQEMVSEEIREEQTEPVMPSFEAEDQFVPEMPTENSAKESCPFCEQENDAHAFACSNCRAIFTVSDLDMILNHTKADQESIADSVRRMEESMSVRGVVAEELKYMGIGYLNLKDFPKGLDYLKEAVQRDPSDTMLASQVSALADKVADIEEQKRIHESEDGVVAKKILVVDDSPTVRKLISGKLEKSGHEPIAAVDGMDALAKINEVIPDLILLDITMPRMDGYQVCKLIRSNEATKDVPVVMISGKDGFFDKVRGKMAGTTNYITKPFGPETLMKAVNEYVG